MINKATDVPKTPALLVEQLVKTLEAPLAEGAKRVRARLDAMDVDSARRERGFHATELGKAFRQATDNAATWSQGLVGSRLGRLIFTLVEARADDGLVFHDLLTSIDKLYVSAEGEPEKQALWQARTLVTGFIDAHGPLIENDMTKAEHHGLYPASDRTGQIISGLTRLLEPVYEVTFLLDDKTESLKGGENTDEVLKAEHAYAGWRHDVLLHIAMQIKDLNDPKKSYVPNAVRLCSLQDWLATINEHIDARTPTSWKNPQTGDFEMVVPFYHEMVPKEMLKAAQDSLCEAVKFLGKEIREQHSDTERFRYLDKPRPACCVSDVELQDLDKAPGKGIS